VTSNVQRNGTDNATSTLSTTYASIRFNPKDRRTFVGGSDARIIMGNDEANLIQLWREKRGEAEPEDLLAQWRDHGFGVRPLIFGGQSRRPSTRRTTLQRANARQLAISRPRSTTSPPNWCVCSRRARNRSQPKRRLTISENAQLRSGNKLSVAESSSACKFVRAGRLQNSPAKAHKATFLRRRWFRIGSNWLRSAKTNPVALSGISRVRRRFELETQRLKRRTPLFKKAPGLRPPSS
jgi:hypothetical protein